MRPWGWSGWWRRLARVDEMVWAPLASGGLVLLAGLVSLWLRQPWLFPSLGPTAFIQAHRPHAKVARFHNTVLGHLLGIVAGYACVVLFGAAHVSSIIAASHVSFARVAASALAVALTMFGELVLDAYHPPAAATTLIITLGVSGATWRGLLGLTIGIAIVAVAGEALRRARAHATPRSGPDEE